MPSTLIVDNLQPRTGTTISIPTGSKLYAPGGVVQTVQTVKTDTWSTTSSSFTDVTGLLASITPTSINSKILVICRFAHSRSTSTTGGHFRITRNGNAVFVGDPSGLQTQSATGSHYQDSYNQIGETITYLDSPSTLTMVTYQLQGKIPSGPTLYVNYSGYNGNRPEDARTASSIILMEIAQ